jgi:hypothetical protein
VIRSWRTRRAGLRVVPINDHVARLRTAPASPAVKATAVVGGAICLQATTSDGVEEFYLDLEQAGQLALELADAIEMAAEFLKEGAKDG